MVVCGFFILDIFRSGCFFTWTCRSQKGSQLTHSKLTKAFRHHHMPWLGVLPCGNKVGVQV